MRWPRGWRRSRRSSSPEDGRAVSVTALDGFDVLDRLSALPVSTWRYAWEPAEVRHLGPMAQDFAAAFRLGDDDRVINHVDANGVLMVSVQALYRKVQELEARLAALEGGKR